MALASPGIGGVVERLLTPPIMRRIYRQELRQLAAYVRSIRTSTQGVPAKKPYQLSEPEENLLMTRDTQLADLETEYQAFVHTVRALSPEVFLASLGDWNSRDILAHLIGWNRITQSGCSEVQQGKESFYFYDGSNDYRKVNAEFIARYTSTDLEALLMEMDASKNALVSYLKGVDEGSWNRDTGVEHYRGGPATVARCVDSLIRDYQKHRNEIAQGTQIYPSRGIQ